MRVKTVLRWVLNFKRYHIDCLESCGRGRCHFCLVKPGPARIRVAKDGTIHAHSFCDAHANMLARRALNIRSEFEAQYCIEASVPVSLIA